jgi:hypothetical protein
MTAQSPPTWQIAVVIAVLLLPATSLAGLLAALLYTWIAKRLAVRRLSAAEARRADVPVPSASHLGPGRSHSAPTIRKTSLHRSQPS